MLADARALSPEAWIPHFNTGIYEGDWSGVALRSPGGGASIVPIAIPGIDRPGATYENTANLERSPALRAALATFETEITSARLLRLGPGARIREHRDYQIGFDAGEIRLHVPLETNDGVEFVLGGRALAMTAGECWYVDVTQPHRVTNHGTSDRIHLVVDCTLNVWLRELIAAASVAAFERFAALVASDPSLQDELWTTESVEAYVNRVVETGLERGFAFDGSDVREAMGAVRRRAIAGVAS